MTVEHFLDLATRGGVVIVELVAAATILLLMTVGCVLVARRHSAAFRHRMWSLSMVSILALPLVSAILPNLGPELGFPIDARPVATNRLAPAAHFTEPVETIRAMHGRRAQSPLSTSNSPRTEGSQWSQLFVVWLLGTCVATVLFMRDLILSRIIVGRAVTVTKGNVISLKEQICRSADVTTDVSLLCSAETSVPLIIGVFRPVIILPAGFGQWTVDRWRVVLSHEIAHVRRRDVLWQAIARLARSLYWFHPLVWFAARQMRVEREFACDDAVLRMGEIPGDYATHLVDVASTVRQGLIGPQTAIAIASRSCIQRRVAAILHPQLNRMPVARNVGRVMFAASLTTVVSISLMGSATNQTVDVSRQSSDQRTVSTAEDSDVVGATIAAVDNLQSQTDKNVRGFELTVRKGNGAYGTAAFSFRFATQDVQKHYNLVDLVYNRCGQLHVDPTGRMRSRIADLGEVNFDAEHSAPKKGWKEDSIQPMQNHVYVQEINDGQQQAFVKFLVADLEQDGTLKVKWSPLFDEKWPHFSPGSGGTAGPLGQCGGVHPEW